MIINAWLIKSTKSAANLTMSKWKGLTTGRQKRGKGLSNPSTAVLDRQTAMAATVELFSTVAAAVKIGFKQFNSTIGNYAAWIKETMNDAWDFTTPGSPSLTYTNLVFAKGSMPNTIPSAVTADASDNAVVVTFSEAIGYGQATTDRMRVVVYNQTDSTWYVNTTSTATRVDSPITFTTPAGFLAAADVIQVFTFFEGQPSTATAGKVSDSNRTEVTVSA